MHGHMIVKWLKNSPSMFTVTPTVVTELVTSYI